MRLIVLALLGTLTFIFATPAAPAPAPAGTAYPQLEAATTTDVSYNWAGYVAQKPDTAYDRVAGTWIVPAVAPGAGPAADATWVGIGGVGSDDLLQAGTEAITDDSGTVYYQAWVEAMPAASQVVPLAVAPGDVVDASILETTPGRWSVTLTNRTSGKHYATSLWYDSLRSSAEWIQEMPSSLGGNFIPLDQFGAVAFLSGPTAEATPLAMVNRHGETLARTSVLGEGGELCCYAI